MILVMIIYEFRSVTSPPLLPPVNKLNTCRIDLTTPNPF